MGVTMTIALAFWLASSFIEYKLIKTFPAARRWIQHPVGGIALSLLIGYGVSIFVGSVGGVGVFLGQLAGLATNSFTFKMYSALEQLNTGLREFAANCRDTWQKNKSAFHDLMDSIRTLFRFIANFFRAIAWVLNLPVRFINLFSRS